jgi:hypothetical protein
MAFEKFTPPQGGPPQGVGLNVNHLRAIALVMTSWATLESALEQHLYLLAQAPPSLGQALTENLGPDHRLKALRRLVKSWERILQGYEEYTDILASVRKTEEYGNWIRVHKDQRNKVAHWHWLGITEQEMVAFKYTLRPGASTTSDNWVRASPDDLIDFATEASDLASQMFALVPSLEKLPPLPRSHAGP